MITSFPELVNNVQLHRKEMMKAIKITDFIPDGIENAISMTKLALIINEDKRTTRKLIHRARLDGEPICSTCEGEGGYYIPRSPEEAYPYYRQQQARINSGIAAINAVSDYIKDGTDNDRTV